MNDLSPEQRARAEAARIAAFHFPRSRVNREALENDVFLALKRFTERAFADGLKVGLDESGSELVVELSGQEATVLAAQASIATDPALEPRPEPAPATATVRPSMARAAGSDVRRLEDTKGFVPRRGPR